MNSFGDRPRCCYQFDISGRVEAYEGNTLTYERDVERQIARNFT
jgi:hypothetical protein